MLRYVNLHCRKPTKFAPIPKPAPVRADTAKVGTYVSRM